MIAVVWAARGDQCILERDLTARSGADIEVSALSARGVIVQGRVEESQRSDVLAVFDCSTVGAGMITGECAVRHAGGAVASQSASAAHADHAFGRVAAKLAGLNDQGAFIVGDAAAITIRMVRDKTASGDIQGP